MARTTVVGACPHDCPDTCSILTTVEDGKAIAVRGNPDHPFTRGRLCVKVNNYEERVYSDKRLLYPLKRVGPKGSKQFQRISWDEAIETIAAADTRVEEVRFVAFDPESHREVRAQLASSTPIRIFQGIQVLHQRGYHRVRALPGLAWLDPAKPDF